MLNDAWVMGFIPTANPPEARAFYVDLLGLTFVHQDDFAIEIDAHGTPIRIVTVPGFAPLPFALLGWKVADIALVTQTMAGRGVVFKRYPWFEQDELGIWTAPDGARVAWFRDPDGNTLSLSQHPA